MQQNRGVSCSRSASQKRKLDSERCTDSSALDMDSDVDNQITDKNSSEPNKKCKINEAQLPADSNRVPSPANNCSEKACSPPNYGTPGLHYPSVLCLKLIVREFYIHV